MDPREFLTLASNLVVGTSPAEIRSAISRAYYAIHHVSSEILSELGAQIKKSGDRHGYVWKCLSNSGDTEIIKVGSQLGDLQSKRNKADYDLANTSIESQKTAQGIVEQTKRMIQIIEGCRSEPKRTKIAKAIQEYEKVLSGM
jgi:uncharacterized protein (UPF0332 family)